MELLSILASSMLGFGYKNKVVQRSRENAFLIDNYCKKGCLWGITVQDSAEMVERLKIAVRHIYVSGYRIRLRRVTRYLMKHQPGRYVLPNLSCLSTASNIRLLALLYHFLIIYCPIFLQSFAHLWNDSLICRQGGVMIVMVAKNLFMYFCTTEIRIMIGFYYYK